MPSKRIIIKTEPSFKTKCILILNVKGENLIAIFVTNAFGLRTPN